MSAANGVTATATVTIMCKGKAITVVFDNGQVIRAIDEDGNDGGLRIGEADIARQRVADGLDETGV